MKLLYFDVETTGLDAQKSAIIQFAYIVEINGKEVEQGNIMIQPFESDIIEQSALDVNGHAKEKLFSDPFIPAIQGYDKIMGILNKYIDKYDHNDKFYPAGYNIGFDCSFLEAFMKKNNNSFYASYFSYLKIDPSCLMLLLNKTDLENYRLSTVCKHYNIPLVAHDAMSDIRATKQLVGLLKDKYIKGEVSK